MKQSHTHSSSIRIILTIEINESGGRDLLSQVGVGSLADQLVHEVGSIQAAEMEFTLRNPVR